MTTLTLVTVVVILYGMVGRQGYGYALALGGSTGAGAAFVAGTIAVPTFYAVAIGTAIALGVRMVTRRSTPDDPIRALPPGVPVLALFTAWSVLVTVTAPLLFDGLAVLLPTGKSSLAAGTITSSNYAQTIYLTLGVCVIAFLARSPAAGPQLIGLAAGATTVLSLWRYGHQEIGLPFPDGVFDNSPNLAYIETAPGGIARFRGILSEPSGLAGSSLVTVSYMLPRSQHVHGWRRAGALFVSAAAVYLGVISTSATFVVASVVVALIAAVTFLIGFLSRRTSVSAIVSVVCCALVVLTLWLLPIVADFVELTVNQKVSSSSYDQRTGANTASYELFLHTFGFGVGLGSNRASSFLAGILSDTGLVGTLLFAAAIVALVRRSAPVLEYRPVIWALIASLVLKVTAGPDMSDNTGITWIALGLLSHAVLLREAGPPGAGALQPPGGGRRVPASAPGGGPGSDP